MTRSAVLFEHVVVDELWKDLFVWKYVPTRFWCYTSVVYAATKRPLLGETAVWPRSLLQEHWPLSFWYDMLCLLLPPPSDLSLLILVHCSIWTPLSLVQGFGSLFMLLASGVYVWVRHFEPVIIMLSRIGCIWLDV
jgi:hypothetical protein